MTLINQLITGGPHIVGYCEVIWEAATFTSRPNFGAIMAPQVFAWSLPTSQVGRLAATNIQNREMRDWQFFWGKLEKIDQYIPNIFHPTNHHVLVNDFNGHLLGPQKSTLLRMFLDDTFPPGKRTEARLRISTLSRRHEWDIGGSVSLGERNMFRVKPIKINIRNKSWVFSVLWIYMGSLLGGLRTDWGWNDNWRIESNKDIILLIVWKWFALSSLQNIY